MAYLIFIPSSHSLLFAPCPDFFIGFEESSYSVSESTGTASVCAVITNAPGGGLENTATVTLGSRNGNNAGL